MYTLICCGISFCFRLIFDCTKQQYNWLQFTSWGFLILAFGIGVILHV
jgi:putative exporter of polyketide antibiotics